MKLINQNILSTWVLQLTSRSTKITKTHLDFRRQNSGVHQRHWKNSWELKAREGLHQDGWLVARCKTKLNVLDSTFCWLLLISNLYISFWMYFVCAFCVCSWWWDPGREREREVEVEDWGGLCEELWVFLAEKAWKFESWLNVGLNWGLVLYFMKSSLLCYITFYCLWIGPLVKF